MFHFISIMFNCYVSSIFHFMYILVNIWSRFWFNFFFFFIELEMVPFVSVISLLTFVVIIWFFVDTSHAVPSWTKVLQGNRLWGIRGPTSHDHGPLGTGDNRNVERLEQVSRSSTPLPHLVEIEISICIKRRRRLAIILHRCYASRGVITFVIWTGWWCSTPTLHFLI